MTRWLLASLYVDSIGRPPNPDSLAFCVTGSLARMDAAPFDDIDCFVILKDPCTSVRMKAVGKVFGKKLLGTMPQDSALAIGRTGIDPVTFCDGPAEIRNLIVQRNMDSLIQPLLNAQVAFGNRELLADLCDLLKKAAPRNLKTQGLSDLKACLRDNDRPPGQPGNCDDPVAIDLERDLARPLASCLNGLARYNGIDVAGVRAQAHELRAAKVISTEVHQMVIACSEVLEEIRATSPLACLARRADTLGLDNANEVPGELLRVFSQVNCLRHMASSYLEWLDSATPVMFGNESPFLTRFPSTYCTGA